MKICKRAIDFVQLYDEYGNARICSWMPDSHIGNMLENSFEDVYHSAKARGIWSRMLKGDYSMCYAQNCPYLSNNTMDKILVEIDELPEYPEELYLAYEGKCNYHCTCCTSSSHMELGASRDWSENYVKLEAEIRKLLPHIKRISANGRGELFTSPHILKMLHDWQPQYPTEECSAVLETNGSLFNEKNWAYISNLGRYRLDVAITVMSFEERTYQYLSGSRMPISNIIENLHFVKSLRAQGVIDYLELATVVQERNFRTLPEFTQRCIEEFGADVVRLRPVFPGGPQDRNIQWFADVRNPEHPYHQEYLDVMKAPVFEHPKVLKWSGDMESDLGEHPGIRAAKELAKERERYGRLAARYMQSKVTLLRLENPALQKLIIYGAGRFGKRMLNWLQDCVKDFDEVCFAVTDTTDNPVTYEGLPVYALADLACKSERAIVILAVSAKYSQEMAMTARQLGFKYIVDIDEE